MKEKELRLAVVCYGGVSLAIYEHGITKEMLKLVRASKAYHAAAGLQDKQAQERDFRAVAGDDPEYCTEAIYFDLLKAIGGSLDLRVIIDVIAGASAGGINGVALARAVAHDLTLEPLTDMWLAEADIDRMLAPEAKARRWSKWYFRPFIDPLASRLMGEGLTPGSPDLEMRAALSTFLRSRWFHPPLDGKGFTALLLDGLKAMGTPRGEGASLLPSGHQLDLIVTVTDFYGSARSIFAHDPPVIQEREHRRALRFAFEHFPGRAAHSELGDDHLPSLAFAARATASYPGAFPPAQIREIDAVLAQRAEPWPGRAHFLESNFRHYADLGIDPESCVLVDGSVLNNKPLAEAVAAARTHRAFREVDRRLVYIDPHPSKRPPRNRGAPGFFTTLRSALSDLPRYEPVYDELTEISAYNDHVRERRMVVEAARTQVGALVETATEGRLTERVTPEALRRWRLNGPNLIASVGLVYNGWIRLMIGESISFIAGLLAAACGYAEASPQRRWIEAVVDCSMARLGLYSASYEHPPVASEAALPLSGRVIANFGVKYKRRRLTFVIQTINQLYVKSSREGECIDPAALDVLKRRLYRCLDTLRVYDDAGFLSPALLADIRRVFAAEAATAEGQPVDADAFAAEHEAELSALLAHLSDECDLVGLNEDVDAVLASPTVFELGPGCQRELLVAYLGFLFWDIVLLPMAIGGVAQDTNTLEEILVDRISPDDARSLRVSGQGPLLRGGTLAGFGGFFSRASRENDYLWGRLHAVDRLIDLVASTAGRDLGEAPLDVRGFKKRAFDCVLKREAGRLTLVPGLIDELRAAVEAL